MNAKFRAIHTTSHIHIQISMLFWSHIWWCNNMIKVVYLELWQIVLWQDQLKKEGGIMTRATFLSAYNSNHNWLSMLLNVKWCRFTILLSQLHQSSLRLFLQILSCSSISFLIPHSLSPFSSRWWHRVQSKYGFLTLQSTYCDFSQSNQPFV